MAGLPTAVTRKLTAVAIVFFVGFHFSKPTSIVEWEDKIAWTDEQANNEFEEHHICQLAREIYTPDFVRMTSNLIIQGDFEALEDDILKWREIGHSKFGANHLIWAIGDSAMAWRKLTFYNETSTVAKGARTNLYVLVGGEAKIKMQHILIESTV